MSIDNKIGVLDGNPVVDRVYVQAETKTAEYHDRVVAILDGVPNNNGEIFSEAEIEFHNPVWVTHASETPNIKNIVGSANLSVRDSKVYADIFLMYDSPDRLAIESGLPVKPCLSGYVNSFRRDSNDNIVVQKMTVKSLVLALHNADARIESL